ncbi:MAG: hypothetical protein JEZ00_02975 [Anaerolineaceae bacterium]|nr:hypothetical protein [Anaerolineaceae bacterium]
MNKYSFAYLITSHGFGHASRACAVMQSLQNKRPDMHFHIYTTIPEWFFIESDIKSFTLHPMETDIGLVQTSPFEIDFDTTLSKLSSFFESYKQQVEQLCIEFHKHDIKAVLCDIAVLGISAAQKLKLPVFLIENFTWDWIYEAYQNEYPAFKPFADTIRNNIKKVKNHYLTEPFCQYPRSLSAIAKPISRPAKQPAHLTKERLGIPDTHKVVLLSLGGIPDQIQINASSMNKTGVTFIVPGIGQEIQKIENTLFLPHHSSFYHPDLVACADAIIAKVGYSTIAEAYASRIPMGYIPRYDFPESKFLSAYSRDKLCGVEIKLNEFLSGRWTEKIDQILQTSLDQSEVLNGAEQISEWILNGVSLNQ